MTMMRKFATELLGTGLLVFFGVGVATLMFGFKFDGVASRRGWWPRPWRSGSYFWPWPTRLDRYRAVTSTRR
jgi:glycerol uptake facilitator-like aquaporin